MKITLFKLATLILIKCIVIIIQFIDSQIINSIGCEKY